MNRILIIVAFLSPTFCTAQVENNAIRSNAIFVEWYLLGNHTGSVGWFSVNYNRKLGIRKKISLRLGMSSDFESSIGVPVIATFVSNPKGKHHFEGGVGVNSRLEFYQGSFYYTPFGMVPLMYRFESNNALLFRGGVNYFFYSYAVWYPVSLQLGLSLGYAF